MIGQRLFIKPVRRRLPIRYEIIFRIVALVERHAQPGAEIGMVRRQPGIIFEIEVFNKPGQVCEKGRAQFFPERQHLLPAEVRIRFKVENILYPASQIPETAKNSGALIIEINVRRTHLTGVVTDIFLEGSASEVFPRLVSAVRALQ